MSYKVNDFMSVAIYIEDKELPLDSGNQLNLLHISAMTQSALPMLHLEFTDLLRVVPSMGLQDGARIIVSLQSTKKVDRYFRVHDWKRAPVGDGFSYGVNCYWDAPMYWAGTSCAGEYGSSYAVLSGIAEKTGLKFSKKNQATADEMTWMAANRTYAMFAKSVARHGYRSDTSHMVLGIDTRGVMRYLDVNSNPTPEIDVGYLDTGRKFVMITDFSPKSSSGMNNALGGYRHDRTLQRVIQEDESENVLTFQPDSKFPLMNLAVRKKIERGVISYAAVDFGNVHHRYERARYQNNRYNLLNSVTGEFLFPFPNEFDLLDNFNYVAPSTSGNTQYNGEYTITGKVIFIAGADYNEKLIAVKNGLN